MNGRPSVEWTATALSLGTLLSAGLLAVALLLSLTQQAAAATLISNAGVIALLATPVVGLVLTYVELRPVQPRVARLALVVLGVLAVSALVAVVTLVTR